LKIRKKALKAGQAIKITTHADPDTGKISTIEAEWGGKNHFFAANEDTVNEIGKDISLKVKGADHDTIEHLSGHKKAEGNYIIISRQNGQLTTGTIRKGFETTEI